MTNPQAMMVEFRADPYAFYPMLRKLPNPLENPWARGWSVFDDGLCREVLRNPALFSSDMLRYGAAGLSDGMRTPINSDPPRHTKLRGLVNLAFTPRRVAAIEPRIRALTVALLDDALARDGFDLVRDLAQPLPVIVIAELLGVPVEDRAAFRQWSDAILVATDGGLDDRGAAAASVQAAIELAAYLGEQIAHHRAAPSDDLIDALLRAEIDGARLSEGELLAFARLLLVAGHGTTANLITNAVRCLIDWPDQQTRLRADPALVADCIEEALRFRSPVQVTRRFVATDTELRGKALRAGDRVDLFLGAANRDPARFPEPDRFVIGRTPNNHLAFGLGIHFCLGAPLARLEAQVALEELLARLSWFAYADDARLEPLDGMLMHGVKALKLAMDCA